MNVRFKKFAFFIGTIALAMMAASYKFPDITKVKGELTPGGSIAKPVILKGDLSQYTLLTAVSIAPSVEGDVVIELQGNPTISYKIYNYKSPVIDLGLSHFHRLEGNVLKDVKSEGKPVFLRVLLRPLPVDPVCGMPREEGFLSKKYGGKTYYFCSKACLGEFDRAPEKYKNRDGFKGKYALVFYGARTGNELLKIPIIFGEREKSTIPEGHVH